MYKDPYDNKSANADVGNTNNDQSIPESNVACEADSIYGSVFDYALEATKRIIDQSTRDSLDDSDFGIPKERKYPLRVPGNKKLSEELVGKAVEMFHFCNPNWKEELAKNIVKMIKSEQLSVKISRKSQIFKHVNISEVPEENIRN